MEALFKERDAIQAENQRLKIANQGLLKDTDFLKGERIRLEESLNQQASEKDTAYQRRIADLNKTVNNLYQQNKVLSDKAEGSYEASKANRELNFDLENNVFELKRQVTALTDKAKSLELEVTVLRKTDGESKHKINEMKNLLLEADERIYVLEKNGGEAQVAKEEMTRAQENSAAVQRQLAEARAAAETATKNVTRLSDELFVKEKQLEENRKEFDRLLDALEQQEKDNVALKTEKDRINQTSVAISAHNLLKTANESLQKEVANLKTLLQETQKSEDFARQSLNELRRKHQLDLTSSQKTNQDTHVEYRAQIERLKESLHTLEEQAATARVELEHSEQTVKNLRAEKEKHAYERVASEAKVTAAERNMGSLEEEVAKLQKLLSEAKEVNEIDSKFKFSESKKLAELKAENLALKKEVMDMKAKLIVANAKSQAEYNRSQKVQQSASILSVADTSMNDGEAMAHRECRRKVRGLQNDYVELQNENMKLRDDVFRLREEKIENLDRSLRLSKVNHSRRLIEGQDLRVRGATSNVLENAADILNGSFLKSPIKAPAEFNVESVLLEQEGAAKALEDVRRSMLVMVSRWEERFKTLKTAKEATARQLVKRLEEIVGECINKNEEFGAMTAAIEEANTMIAKLEFQKKALLDELRDGPSSSYDSEMR
jgi:chromosome segregation ATPase